MLTKSGGEVDTAGNMTAATTMRGKSFLGVFHAAAFVRFSLKSGVAAEAAAVPAAVCMVLLAILVSTTKLLYVLEN